MSGASSGAMTGRSTTSAATTQSTLTSARITDDSSDGEAKTRVLVDTFDPCALSDAAIDDLLRLSDTPPVNTVQSSAPLRALNRALHQPLQSVMLPHESPSLHSRTESAQRRVDFTHVPSAIANADEAGWNPRGADYVSPFMPIMTAITEAEAAVKLSLIARRVRPDYVNSEQSKAIVEDHRTRHAREHSEYVNQLLDACATGHAIQLANAPRRACPSASLR